MEKNFEKYSNKNGTIYHGDALDILSSNKHSKICLKSLRFLGYYAQWFFFTIGIFVVAGGIGMMIAQSCGK